MLQGEHSAIHWTFIKLPFVIKIFVLSIFETGSTVYCFKYSVDRFRSRGVYVFNADIFRAPDLTLDILRAPMLSFVELV